MDKNMKSIKKMKGITLIALVVTIVVLLILAGVTISTLFGDNGIITAARKAAEDTKIAENTVGDALNDLADEMQYQINGTIKSAEEYLTDIRANLSTYKSKAQALGQTTDQNIGIGTDGEVANLDLWYYVKTDNGTGISLGNSEGCDNSYGYKPENIVDGRIQGKVPQYIYYTSEDKFYPIKSMHGTFAYGFGNREAKLLKYAPEIPSTVKEMNCTFIECASLITAPTIPSSVTDMGGTFSGCTGLTTAPTIPSSVTNMDGTFQSCIGLTTAPAIPSSVTSMYRTFYGCTKLQGDLVINANPTSYYDCLYNAGKDATSKLYLTGSSTMLTTLLNTKGNSTNIEIK